MSATQAEAKDDPRRQIFHVDLCPSGCRAAQARNKTVNRHNEYTGVCDFCRQTCRVYFDGSRWRAQ